jgi:hypothetical protein
VIGDVTTEVHTAFLTGKSYPNGLEVTEFPVSSIGNWKLERDSLS